MGKVMVRELNERKVNEKGDEKGKSNPYIKYIFNPPKKRKVKKDYIPIRQITMGAKELVTRKTDVVIVSDVRSSNLYYYLKEKYSLEPVKKGYLPRWTDWTSSDNSVMVRDIIDLLIGELKPFLGDVGYSDFTKYDLLDTRFKISKHLFLAVNNSDKITSVVYRNVDGGIDIIAEVESFSNRVDKYYVMISVNKEGVRSLCTCPSGNLICKHQIAVIASHIPEIVGSLHAIKTGSMLEKSISEFKRVHSDTITKLSSLETSYENVWEAYIYYFVKYLMKTGLIKPMKLSSSDREKIGEKLKHIIYGGLPEELKENERRKIKKIEVSVGKSEIEEIVWTNEMKEAVKRVRKLIKDIQLRFGIRSGISDWAKMLAFSVVMSADYTKPPVNIHALGDVGTFKTTGSRLIAQYVKTPELIISGTGEPVEVYEKIIKLISRNFGIPPDSIYGRIGGIITKVARKGDNVEVGVSIPFLYSILSSRSEGLSVYKKFIKELKDEGFVTETQYKDMTVDVKDHIQLAKLEHYRFNYLPDEKLGNLIKHEVFDNYILVIDEGSRNPDALEGMLTRMTISSLNEGVRVIIVTDNLEPHIMMASNPEYTPLYDRMYMVITPGIIDELTSMEYLYKEPSVKFDMVTLLGIRKFIDSIPVSEEADYIIKSIGNALGYKFVKVYTEDGTVFLKPIKRNENSTLEIDLFEGVSDFDFARGNRFPVHTIELAKFNAFLNKHSRVTDKDIIESLYITIPSRLVVNANSYSDYKEKIIGVVDRATNKINDMKRAMIDVAGLVTHLVNKNYDDALAKFEEIMRTIEIKPEYAPVLMSGLELYISLQDYNIDELPTPIAYTIGEIILIKGDLGRLVGTTTFKRLRELHRKMEMGE